MSKSLKKEEEFNKKQFIDRFKKHFYKFSFLTKKLVLGDYPLEFTDWQWYISWGVRML